MNSYKNIKKQKFVEKVVKKNLLLTSFIFSLTLIIPGGGGKIEIYIDFCQLTTNLPNFQYILRVPV